MRSISMAVRQVLLLVMVLCALGVGVKLFQAEAQCSPWYRCPISQYFGASAEYGREHGDDLLTHGLPITALLPGRVTFVHQECWEYPCVMDITWKLDHPSRGQPYAYAQIASSYVRVGQHVSGSTVLGRSGSFIEWGLTPDWAYGVSNWRWGANPLPVIRDA